MKQKRDRLNDESRLSRFTTHVVLIFASFLAFGPFVWMFLTSIKTYEETIQIPMKFLPEIPQWVNFSIVSDKLNFPQLYLNTILVTIMMIVGQILIVTICAYAFDRLNFPGKNVLFMGMLALMMVPGQIFIIPRFKLMVNLGLTNTLVGLVLPGLFNIFGVFLMRQFFSTLPRELDEAARIDGASQWTIFWRIVMPNVKSAWLTLMLLSVQNLWAVGANRFIYKEELKTLPYALGQILSGGIARAGVGAAVTVLMMLVPIAIFVFSQSNIIDTMASSGMKD